MKKLGVLIFLFSVIFQGLSQTQLNQLDTIIVGEGQVWYSISDLPVNLFWNYSYNQMIFYPDEIRRPIVIDKIGFQLYASTFNDSEKWDFYIGLTDKQQFETDDDFILLDSVASPQFYDAYSTYKNLLWIDIPDFTFKGDSNLVIGVYEKSYGYEEYPSYFLGYLHNKSKVKAMGIRSTSPIDVYNLPSASFQNNVYLPQLYIIGYPLAYQIDAALTKIITDSICSADEPISLDVEIRNHGTDVLTSVSIHWVVNNGNRQTIASGTYSWSGNLSTNERQNVNIGSVSLSPGQYELTVYLSNPNSTDDQFHASDTLRKRLNVSPGCKHRVVLSTTLSRLKTGQLSVYVGDSLFYSDLDLFHLSNIEYPVFASNNDTVFIKYSVSSSVYLYKSFYWKFYDNKGNLLIDDYVYNYNITDTAFPECKLDYDLAVSNAKLTDFEFVLEDQTYYPCVQIKNLGKNSASGFDVNVKILENNNLVYNQTQSVSETLLTDQTYELTFNQPFATSDSGSVKLIVNINYPNDLDNTNNCDTVDYGVLEKVTVNSPQLYAFSYNKFYAFDTNFNSISKLDTILIPPNSSIHSLTLWGSSYNNFYILGLLNSDQIVIFNADGKNKVLPKYKVDGRSPLVSIELKYDIYNDKLWILLQNSEGVKQLAEYDFISNSATVVYSQSKSLPLLSAVNFAFLGDGSLIYVDLYGYFYRLDSINDPNSKELFRINYNGYPYNADITVDRYNGQIYLWKPSIINGSYRPVLYKYNWITNTLDSVGYKDYSLSGLSFASFSGFKLPVKIVDNSTNNPIPYAGFRIRQMPWKTDANGTQTIYLPDGNYSILAYAKDYDTTAATVQINGQDADTLIIKLKKANTFINEVDQMIKIYPNPATDYVFITSTEAIISAQLINLEGKVLKTINPFNNNFAINIKDLYPGFYLLRLKTTKNLAVLQIIKH